MRDIVDNYVHTLESCALNFAFSAISGKWKPYILWYLHSTPDGVCRYGELKRLVPYDISHKIFTQQLQELESYNVIKRTEYDEKPKRVEYSLTEEGRLLIPAILYMRDWASLRIMTARLTPSSARTASLTTASSNIRTTPRRWVSPSA